MGVGGVGGGVSPDHRPEGVGGAGAAEDTAGATATSGDGTAVDEGAGAGAPAEDVGTDPVDDPANDIHPSHRADPGAAQVRSAAEREPTDEQRQLFEWGNAAAKRGEYKTAEARFRQLADDPTLPPKQQAVSNYNLGCTLMAQGKNKEAAAAFKKAADTEGGREELREEAARAAEQLSKEPPTPEAGERWSQAKIAAGRGDHDIAAARFKQLADDTNLSPRARAYRTWDMAVCLEKAGKTDQAIDAYSRARDHPGATEETRREAQAQIDRLQAARQ